MSLSKIATHRISDTALLEACARSGQVDSRQMHAHQVAGELRLTQEEGGYECALPIQMLCKERAVRRPWGKYALIVAACLMWAVLLVYGS